MRLVTDRSFDCIWGFSALIGSALMFALLKTNIIIIRHFSFKDTLLLGVASVGKVAVMAVVLLLFGNDEARRARHAGS